jgi:hypothetical protein
VRERLVREKIVCNIHKEKQHLQTYIEQIFGAAKFLEYQATEGQIVDRVMMNLHPSNSDHLVLLDRSRSLKYLYGMVEVVEERQLVARERQRVEMPLHLSSSARLGALGTVPVSQERQQAERTRKP